MPFTEGICDLQPAQGYSFSYAPLTRQWLPGYEPVRANATLVHFHVLGGRNSSHTPRNHSPMVVLVRKDVQYDFYSPYQHYDCIPPSYTIAKLSANFNFRNKS